METVFITAGLLLVTLTLVANYMVQGIGGMASPLRQVGLFLLNKAPAGLIDLFNDKAGSGTKTWMRFGMAWFFMAALGMFFKVSDFVLKKLPLQILHFFFNSLI